MIGRKLSDEHRKKLCEASRHLKPNLGKKLSLESRKKLSVSLKKYYASGGIHPNLGKKASLETRKKLSLARMGKIRTPETREKIRESKLGCRNPNWKNGISTQTKLIKESARYRSWRESVVRRDEWTCVWCKKIQGWDKEKQQQVKIHADHIKPFALFPELRFDINNGRTLCVDCHRKTPTYGWKIYNNKKETPASR